LEFALKVLKDEADRRLIIFPDSQARALLAFAFPSWSVICPIVKRSNGLNTA
jgi:hypothetical protein